MHQFTPAQKLMQGILRIEHLWKIAEENAPLAPAPGGEALSQIHQLATEALLILNSLRGQVGSEP
jgi:hypothetical protein